MRIPVTTFFSSWLMAGLVWIGLYAPVPTLGQSSVSLTVSDQTMQEVIGLGFSIHRGKGSYLSSDPTVRQNLYQRSFDGFNSLVFWSYIENPTERDQIVAEAQQQGLEHIIVNTTGEPQTPEEHARNLFAEIHEYMTAGYPIYGTTLMNKPNTNESDTRRVAPTFLTAAAKMLRAKLDSAGYTSIKIGGPSTVEWAPYIDPTTGGASHGYGFEPGDNLTYLQAFLDDSAALAVLDAFDFQSYGWSMRDTVRQLAEQLGKEQWVTLAAIDGRNNNNGDPMLATAIAANLLSNLNHGVGSWNHWVWDQLFNFNNAQPNLRFRYLQAIGQYFDPGAVVRRVWADPSQPTPSMAWNYYDINSPANNLQPEVVAAAALNPDSTYTLAVINLSGIHAQHFLSDYYPNEAETFAITLQIDELLDVPGLVAYPLVCGNNGQFTEEIPLTIENGQISFNLGSKDMILLRTEKIPAPVTSDLASLTPPALSLYPNPVQDRLHLRLPAGPADKLALQLYDYQGRLVGHLPAQAVGAAPSDLSWNLPPQLANGLYLVRLDWQQGARPTTSEPLRIRVQR
jgi:hypothetical protein